MVDTSVVIDLEAVDSALLPAELAISALTLAELAGGTHAAKDDDERARRQDMLQRVESAFESLPFDSHCARAHGRVCAAVESGGRKVRGAHVVDLLIAATAIAHELPLYMLNAKDLRGLDNLLEIVDLRR